MIGIITATNKKEANMFAILRTLYHKIKAWAFADDKGQVVSSQEHWVNHIHDDTVTWPNGAMMWCNVHGFDEGSGGTYWLGLDLRSFGIRCADYLLKFRSKALYEEYLDAAHRDTKNILYKMRNDSRLDYSYGDSMDTEFIFRWGDDSKLFHIHLGVDSYAEQR